MLLFLNAYYRFRVMCYKKYFPVCFHNEGNLIGHSTSTEVKMNFILRVHHGRNATERMGEMTSLLFSGLNYAYFIKINGDSMLYFQGSLADRHALGVFLQSECLITLQLSTLHLQFGNPGARTVQKHDITLFSRINGALEGP